VRLEGLRQLKKIHLIVTRTRDLPVCSIVPQPTTLQRAPRRYKAKREVISMQCNRLLQCNIKSAGFDVLTATVTKSRIVLDIMPYNSLTVNRLPSSGSKHILLSAPCWFRQLTFSGLHGGTYREVGLLKINPVVSTRLLPHMGT
jgi:hypothetical protein